MSQIMNIIINLIVSLNLYVIFTLYYCFILIREQQEHSFWK